MIKEEKNKQNSKVLPLYKSKADNYICSIVYSQQELAKSNYDLECNDGTVTPDEMLGFAASQITIFRITSYETKLSSRCSLKYPTRIHDIHRGATVASYKDYEGFTDALKGIIIGTV